jgi:thymidylate synthase
MNNTDKQYLDLVNLVLNEGEAKEDRTGVGTIGVFGHQMRFKMSEGFPLLTLKKTHHPAIVHELLWFLNSMPEQYNKYGNTNIKYLVDNNCNIWNEWAYECYTKHCSKMEEPDMDLLIEETQESRLRVMTQNEFIQRIKDDNAFALFWGELGPIYGRQWTAWENIGNDQSVSWINQIDVAINKIKTFPEDRGIIVSAWNVSQLGQMALRPCHTMFQFYAVKMSLDDKVKYMNKNYPLFNEFGWDLRDEEYLKEVEFEYQIPKYKLSLQLYQRSCDIGLGLPFNIASYALLLEMVAQVTGMVANEFIHTIGDAHIYSNHVEKLSWIKNREGFNLPKLQLNKKIKNITDFRFEDINIEDYQSGKGILLPVAV